MKKSRIYYLIAGIIVSIAIAIAGAVVLFNIYAYPEIRVSDIGQEGDEIFIVVDYVRLSGGLKDKRIHITLLCQQGDEIIEEKLSYLSFYDTKSVSSSYKKSDGQDEIFAKIPDIPEIMGEKVIVRITVWNSKNRMSNSAEKNIVIKPFTKKKEIPQNPS
jgi:hypothetical protein